MSLLQAKLRWPISATAKLTFPRQNLLFHGKIYFSTAKLTFSRQNLLSHGFRSLSVYMDSKRTGFETSSHQRFHKKNSWKFVTVAFANIFMSVIETEIILHSSYKPLVWKRYIDDIFSLWNIDKRDTGSFLELANNYHATIKFTAEISDTEITFLDTYVYKGERFKRESIVDVRTHFKPTETFQYTEFTSCHLPGVWKGFTKGEALRLLRTNSSERTFEENIRQFKRRLRARGYSGNLSERILSGVKVSKRMSALQNKQKTHQRILSFVTEYRPLCLIFRTF